MEKVKHTPGPWTVGAKDRPRSDLSVCTQINGVTVPIFYHDLSSFTYYTCAANARLIAAAPELLQSVNSLAEFIKFYSEQKIDGLTKIEHDFELDAVLNQARTAIARATR